MARLDFVAIPCCALRRLKVLMMFSQAGVTGNGCVDNDAKAGNQPALAFQPRLQTFVEGVRWSCEGYFEVWLELWGSVGFLHLPCLVREGTPEPTELACPHKRVDVGYSILVSTNLKQSLDHG